MALYFYIKENNSFKKKTINYLSYFSLTLGFLLLFWSFYPIIAFEIYSRLFIQNSIINPLTKSDEVNSLKQINSVLGEFNIISNNLRDFTQVNLWFPSANNTFYKKNINIKQYNLSIPKLNIKNAQVVVNGEDLLKSLVHFQAQSLPGELGNVVIFGHSTLPQLYNPKDYKTIFTYLPSLEKGDKILIDVQEVKYEYEIIDMIVVNPEEISVLEQKNDGVYLTLITCVPPGTYWKRLVVKAKLTQMQ